MALVSFALVAVGVMMISLGCYMSLQDWKEKRKKTISTTPDSFSGNVKALAKLAEALKDYPAGQQLIVWGIVVLIIAGLFGGITKL
jgi:predicted PurR-regulated permease PerM